VYLHFVAYILNSCEWFALHGWLVCCLHWRAGGSLRQFSSGAERRHVQRADNSSTTSRGYKWRHSNCVGWIKIAGDGVGSRLTVSWSQVLYPIKFMAKNFNVKFASFCALMSLLAQREEPFDLRKHLWFIPKNFLIEQVDKVNWWGTGQPMFAGEKQSWCWWWVALWHLTALCGRYVDYDLGRRMKETQADLIVLEGMGRAIHTNFYAPFVCDVLKLAVIKNDWLAAQLGGDMYSVVFKYERARKVTARWCASHCSVLLVLLVVA